MTDTDSHTETITETIMTETGIKTETIVTPGSDAIRTRSFLSRHGIAGTLHTYDSGRYHIQSIVITPEATDDEANDLARDLGYSGTIARKPENHNWYCGEVMTVDETETNTETTETIVTTQTDRENAYARLTVEQWRWLEIEELQNIQRAHRLANVPVPVSVTERIERLSGLYFGV